LKLFFGLFNSRGLVEFGNSSSKVFSGFFLRGFFDFSGIFLIDFLLFSSLKIVSPDLELFGIKSFMGFILIVLRLSAFVFKLATNFFLSSFLSESHSSDRFIKLSKS